MNTIHDPESQYGAELLPGEVPSWLYCVPSLILLLYHFTPEGITFNKSLQCKSLSQAQLYKTGMCKRIKRLQRWFDYSEGGLVCGGLCQSILGVVGLLFVLLSQLSSEARNVSSECSW